MTIHTAFCAQYGPTVLPGVQSLSQQTNPEVSNPVTIGSPYPQFVALRGMRPTIPMSSEAVATILGVTGSVGADIDLTNQLRTFYALMDRANVVAAGPHKVYTADRGILVPRQLSCQHQGDSLLNFDAVLFSPDGSTAPFSIGTVTALPTIPQDNVKHTIAKVRVAGIDMGCTIGVNVDFANNIQSRGCNSDVFDTFLEQPGVQPVITLTGLNADIFSSTNIPVEGRRATHANTEIFLRRRDPEGLVFVDDATPQHIKLDAEGMVIVTEHRGQGTTSAEVDVQITCSLDAAGNPPIGVNVASAIT